MSQEQREEELLRKEFEMAMASFETGCRNVFSLLSAMSMKGFRNSNVYHQMQQHQAAMERRNWNSFQAPIYSRNPEPPPLNLSQSYQSQSSSQQLPISPVTTQTLRAMLAERTTQISQIICNKCHTKITSAWRKDTNNQWLCNSCCELMYLNTHDPHVRGTKRTLMPQGQSRKKRLLDSLPPVSPLTYNSIETSTMKETETSAEASAGREDEEILTIEPIILLDEEDKEE